MGIRKANKMTKGWWVIALKSYRIVFHGVKPSLFQELLGLLLGIRVLGGPFISRDEAKNWK
jgi:hypothetical protein